ncbi:hypothetical protein [Pseudomonas indica]|uniref:hypothetical protein n=1 Tax=Pseudomonas indica TaxID=137658 RepID=UPI000BABE39D|nr:hypothetical protein [Pseudomonas indica]PAU61729.1 hypothetical protein BZL42_07645 [Pseudomonas indica]
MQPAALLIAATLLASPAAFAISDSEVCESRLEQLEAAIESLDPDGALEDVIENLKDQAEEAQDDGRYAECIAIADRALQQLNAPMISQ